MTTDNELKDEIEATTGFKVLDDTAAKESVEVYKDYKGARSVRYNDMVENDRFYHGVHYTDAEETEIIARGQAPLAINATYSLMKQMISLITAQDPIWHVDPVTDADKPLAYVMRDLMNGSWYLSRGGRQFSQIVKESVVTGHGFGIVNPVHDNGFWVRFQQLPYHSVYLSPTTREFDYSDSENIVISKVLSHVQIAEFFGKKLKWVEDHAGKLDPDEGDDEKTIKYARYVSPMSKMKQARLTQRLTMESSDYWLVKPSGGDQIQQRIFFSLPPHIEKKIKSGSVVATKVSGKRVVAKYISLGDYCEKYYMPLSSYNVVPFVDEFNGNPYPLGEVDFLYGIQRAVDKFVLLAILNATLSNNMKVMAVKGTIDKDYFAENYAIPGSLIEYDWREGMPPPTQVNPQPLNAEFYAFPKTLISLMEYITGIFGVVQGNPEGAPRTASGLMSLQNYGGQKVKLLARNMQDALSTLGDVAVQLYQNYAPYNAFLSYTKETDNEMVGVRYNTVKSVDNKLTIDNDITKGRYRVRTKVIQNYGSERDLKANLLANLAAQTKSPALIKPIIKLADIPEADEVLKELDELAKAGATIQQLQQQLKRLQEMNVQLENQLVQAGIKMKVNEAEKDISISAEKAKAKGTVDVNNIVNQAQMEQMAEQTEPAEQTA